MPPLDAPSTFILSERRRKLAEQFAIAARLYAEAVASLTSDNALSPTEYDRLYKAAEDARCHSEQMRRAFEEHVASHRCGCNDALAESQTA